MACCTVGLWQRHCVGHKNHLRQARVDARRAVGPRSPDHFSDGEAGAFNRDANGQECVAVQEAIEGAYPRKVRDLRAPGATTVPPHRPRGEALRRLWRDGSRLRCLRDALPLEKLEEVVECLRVAAEGVG